MNFSPMVLVCSLSLLLPYTGHAKDAQGDYEVVRSYNTNSKTDAKTQAAYDKNEKSKAEIMPAHAWEQLASFELVKAVESGTISLVEIVRKDKPPLEIGIPLKVEGHNVTINKGVEIDGETTLIATLRDDAGMIVSPDISEVIETKDNKGVKRCYKFEKDTGNRDEVTEQQGADAAAVPEIKHYITIAIDTSGSMWGKPFEQSITAADTLLKALPTSTQCRVFGFHHTITPLHTGDGQTCGDIDLSSLEADGGTDIYGLLNSEYQFYSAQPDTPAIQSLIVITDGYDSAGSLSDADLQRLKTAKGKTLSFVYFRGQDQNHETLKGLSDSVLEQKNLAFDLNAYLDTLKRNIEAQQVLREVPCKPENKDKDNATPSP